MGSSPRIKTVLEISSANTCNFVLKFELWVQKPLRLRDKMLHDDKKVFRLETVFGLEIFFHKLTRKLINYVLYLTVLVLNPYLKFSAVKRMRYVRSRWLVLVQRSLSSVSLSAAAAGSQLVRSSSAPCPFSFNRRTSCDISDFCFTWQQDTQTRPWSFNFQESWIFYKTTRQVLVKCELYIAILYISCMTQSTIYNKHF